MKQSNVKLGLTIGIIAIVLFLGITITKAYYHNTSSISILAALIGDFNSVNGDINIVYYKETDPGEYVSSYSAPSAGYTFNDTLTECSTTCSNSDPTAACYYHYNNSNKTITLTSDKKVTCNFYFDKEAEADIIVNILTESSSGTYSYNNKTYSLVNNIPAFGFEYTEYYSCTNNTTISYDSSTRLFTADALQKDVCYVYFDSNGASADIIVYVYAQNGDGTYSRVESIPTNHTYTLSVNPNYVSGCTDANATVSYTNGIISVDATEKQTCNVYLDLVS